MIQIEGPDRVGLESFVLKDSILEVKLEMSP